MFVLPGTSLLEAAARAGFIIDTPCGGSGKCGKCIVRVADGDCPATSEESSLLSADQLADGLRLACSARVHCALTVEIPSSSLLETQQKILEQGAGGSAGIQLDTTATDRRGIAFDIGTTTIVGTLVDLATGEDMAVASEVNPQVSAGDDVIARIKRCRDGHDGLLELHASVISAVNAIIDELLSSADIESNTIDTIVFAGNTTMQHILCGDDPSPLGEMPFEPASCAAKHLQAKDLTLDLEPETDVYVYPMIGGFIGGDIVAGVAASRLAHIPGPVLFVDIGTNGELVLAHEDRMMAVSVAAGPAFEGARIVSGMRAASGAIEKVVCEDDVQINVIGNTKPAGLCGTGLVDAVAEMLRIGVLDYTGSILGPADAPADLSPALAARLVETDGHFDFVLVTAEESATGEPVCICQKDIRELQLANAAIRAGILILLKMNGLEPKDLEAVLMAGAFGNFIRRKNAVRIGMLPAIESSRIRYVGNTASSGAKRTVLSVAERDNVEQLANDIEHVDLSLDPDFQMLFGEAMLFPEDD